MAAVRSVGDVRRAALSVLTNEVAAVTTGEVKLGSEFDRPGYGWTVVDRIDSTTRVRVWPGFAVGLRF